MTDHRYSDDEVREIFGLAVREGSPESSPPRSSNGLTLVEIQEIGREVGLEASVLANAVATFDARATRLPRRTSLGMPIEARHTVTLSREPTESEWNELVGELRSTFGARGKVRTEGGLREWWNGNLHACVEPAQGGWRLRIGTVKGNASALNTLGVTGLVTGAIGVGALMISGGLLNTFTPVMIGASGTALLLANMLRLPRWASQREQQMEYIAGKATAMVQAAPAAAGREPETEQ